MQRVQRERREDALDVLMEFEGFKPEAWVEVDKSIFVALISFCLSWHLRLHSAQV